MPHATISDQAFLAPVKADPYRNTNSLEFGFRAKRFRQVQRLIEAILSERGTADILDLGGTETYWKIGEDFIKANRHRLRFTIVNTEDQHVEQRDVFAFHKDSATNPTLLDGKRFDLVHSNSVVEHVGSWMDMEDFAANTRRLAPRYYMQTPNFWFPYEPHFRTPGFQYLPVAVRERLIMRYSLGFFRRIGTIEEARDIIYHHHLLSTREIRKLFPDAKVSHEKVAGLNKSIIAIRDIPAGR